MSVPLRFARSVSRPCLSSLVLVLTVACGGSSSTDPAAGAPIGPAPDSTAGQPTAEVKAPPGDDELAERYVAARTLLETPGQMSPPQLSAVVGDLKQISNQARDPHLRANAALLLGSIEEGRGAREQAIGYYRHAAKLVPDDAGPHMALAVALAAGGDHAGAARAQLQAAKLDPDNLENWLLLGEMRVKAGDKDGATEAYAAYELRRKGLIDGLTLVKKGDAKAGEEAGDEGTHVSPPEMRAGCARALAAASDNGTALALLYALETEPEATVREAIAETMGVQRLRGYEEPLKKHLEKESAPAVKKAIEWALAEIQRDPVDARPASKPE